MTKNFSHRWREKIRKCCEKSLLRVHRNILRKIIYLKTFLHLFGPLCDYFWTIWLQKIRMGFQNRIICVKGSIVSKTFLKFMYFSPFPEKCAEDFWSFRINFSSHFSKLHSMFPQEQFQWKLCPKKFSKWTWTLSGFLWDFWRKMASRLSKQHFTCPNEYSRKMYSFYQFQTSGEICSATWQKFLAELSKKDCIGPEESFLNKRLSE